MLKFAEFINKNILNLFVIITLLTILPQTVFIRGHFDVAIRFLIIMIYCCVILSRIIIFKLYFSFSEVLWFFFTIFAIIGALFNSKSLPLDIIQPLSWWIVAIGIVSFVRIAKPDDQFIKRWLIIIIYAELFAGLISLIDFFQFYNFSNFVSSNVRSLGKLSNVNYFGCFIGSYTFGQEIMTGLLAALGVFIINVTYSKKNNIIKEYFIFIILFILFLPLLIYSQDRSSILAFFVTFIIALFMLVKDNYLKLKMSYSIIFILIFTFLLILLYLAGILQPLIIKVLTSGTSHRTEIWADVIQEQMKAP
ncbi:MAG TPA: hypothetical protein PLZ38_13580, partial [Spirochaetota bacterium]|nr:hypothetical protein [Spirochaetota bacterium]